MTSRPDLERSPKSMTAAGHAQLVAAGHRYLLELKSLNSKGLDVRCALPDELATLELKARALISAQLTRGKVELKVKWAGIQGAQGAHSAQPSFDEPLFESLIELHQARCQALWLESKLSPEEVGAWLRWPGVLSSGARPPLEALEIPFCEALERALTQLTQMRATEGEALLGALNAHLTRLHSLVHELEALLPSLQEARAQQLTQRLNALLTAELSAAHTLSSNDPRLLTELALLADRSDVSEELTRLKAHLEHAKQLLTSAEPSGRRCDFLCQELLREANTASSKLHEVEVTHLLVELKAEIERLREQIQNIE